MINLKKVLDENEQSLITNMLAKHEDVACKYAEWQEANHKLAEAKKSLSHLLIDREDVMPDIFLASSRNQTYLVTVSYEDNEHKIDMLVAELR